MESNFYKLKGCDFMNYEKLWNELKSELTNAQLHHKNNNKETACTMRATLAIMRYLENKQIEENNTNQMGGRK